MLAYILRRILMAVPLLFGISLLSFAIMKLAPGDPTVLILEPGIRPAT